MTMWFSSQHFHPLEIKAKRMNALIVGVHFHFKWDVTTGYEEKHLVMVIQLCKIAAFHPVNSDIRLSQSLNYKIFSEGRTGHCPVEGSCPGRSLWEQSQAAQPNCLWLKPGASCLSRFKYGSVLLYPKGLLLSMELSAWLTSLQNEGLLGRSKSNQWHIQSGPGRPKTPAWVTAASLTANHIAPGTHTPSWTDVRLALSAWGGSATCDPIRPHGFALLNLMGITSCRCYTQCYGIMFWSPECHSMILMNWAWVMMPCDGHTSPRGTHSVVKWYCSNQSPIPFVIVSAWCCTEGGKLQQKLSWSQFSY